MTKPKQKSLGQIAYEADPCGKQREWGSWKEASPSAKAIYEIEAAAVAREVKRRLRVKARRR